MTSSRSLIRCFGGTSLAPERTNLMQDWRLQTLTSRFSQDEKITAGTPDITFAPEGIW